MVGLNYDFDHDWLSSQHKFAKCHLTSIERNNFFLWQSSWYHMLNTYEGYGVVIMFLKVISYPGASSDIKIYAVMRSFKGFQLWFMNTDWPNDILDQSKTTVWICVGEVHLVEGQFWYFLLGFFFLLDLGDVFWVFLIVCYGIWEVRMVFVFLPPLSQIVFFFFSFFCGYGNKWMSLLTWSFLRMAFKKIPLTSILVQYNKMINCLGCES